jgi:TonB family protein
MSSKTSGAWALIVVAHCLIAWTFVASTRFAGATAPIVVPLQATILITNNPDRANGKPIPLVTSPVVLEDFSEHLSLILPPPPIVFALGNDGAVRTAPQLLDGAQPPIEPYAHRAGLLKGESAFVVLRVQVLAAGSVGQVEIDVSSGSRQVDEAATDYVRTTRWIAGRLGASEEVSWIRMGLRLAA